METTGIVRKLDKMGRIVLPKELRETLDLEIGDSIEVFLEGQNLVLRKYKRGCVICGNMEGLQSFSGKQVCKKCLETMITTK